VENTWQTCSFRRGIGLSDASTNFGKKYRSSFETIAFILEAASTGASRFAIAHRLNTNYSHLRKYLDFLIKMGFINVEINEGQISYKTCEKGFEFLRLYHVLLRMFVSETRQVDVICPPVHQSSCKI
jgi:predicted transcriptional regulator